MSNDPNISYVVASYAVAGIVLCVTTLVTMARLKKATRMLQSLEDRQEKNP